MIKMIRLVQVDTSNFSSLLDLQVNESQKDYVADNAYSLAQAYACSAEGRSVQPFGIYDGDVPVGFLMISYNCFNSEEAWGGPVPYYVKDSYYIWRFMVDKKYQGRGYGKAAMALLLNHIKSFPLGSARYCWISYEPQNAAARNLYLSTGFVEHPEDYVEGEEMPAVLTL